MPRSGRHLRSQSYGVEAETIAAWWLRLKGYTVLARRFRASGAEIDMIARRGKMLIFVEVKARPDLGDALAAVSAQKARQISRAARAWLSLHPAADGVSFRLDAVILSRAWLPKHVEAVHPLEVG